MDIAGQWNPRSQALNFDSGFRLSRHQDLIEPLRHRLFLDAPGQGFHPVFKVLQRHEKIGFQRHKKMPRTLGAVQPGEAARVWRSLEGDNAQARVAVREMAGHLGGAERIVTYAARPLVELLSHPQVLHAAR